MDRVKKYVAVAILLGLGGAAHADELCGFVDEVAATPAEAVKGEVLEKNVTAGDFTIHETALRPPLDGFRSCVLEQRTKNDGTLSRLLVCHHGDGEHGTPLPEERFTKIGERLDACTGIQSIGFGGRRMWQLSDHGLKRIDLVSEDRGARVVLVYGE